jgi:NAD(P)-dependent dehydrogenase (short-subunit alcohol dehydrogenase family)
MSMQLANEVALITGASRGLGLALAHELADAGAKVAMVARDGDALAAAVREVGEGRAFGFVADVAQFEAAVRLVGAVAARVGTPSVVVHNASSLGPEPLVPLVDTDHRAFVSAFATNVFGPFALTRAVVGSMVLRGRGTIVHVSSDAAVEAYPRWGAYGASKAALDHLSRIWAAELEGTGVGVHTIDPGEMATKMHATAVPDADPATLADPRVVARRIVEALVRGRLQHGARAIASTLGEAA